MEDTFSQFLGWEFISYFTLYGWLLVFVDSFFRRLMSKLSASGEWHSSNLFTLFVRCSTWWPALPSSPPHLFCEYRFSAQRGLIDLARAAARATWLRPVLKHLAKKEIPSLPSRRCKGWICISSSCVRLVSSISEDLVAVGQIWRWPLERPHATFHSAIILENPHWHHTLRNTCVLSKEQYWMQRGVAKYHVVIFEFVFSEFCL